MKIIADVAHIIGYYELNLNEEEYINYKNLSDKDKIDYIEDNGNFYIDESRIHNTGEIIKIREENDCN